MYLQNIHMLIARARAVHNQTTFGAQSFPTVPMGYLQLIFSWSEPPNCLYMNHGCDRRFAAVQFLVDYTGVSVVAHELHCAPASLGGEEWQTRPIPIPIGAPILVGFQNLPPGFVSLVSVGRATTSLGRMQATYDGKPVTLQNPYKAGFSIKDARCTGGGGGGGGTPRKPVPI